MLAKKTLILSVFILVSIINISHIYGNSDNNFLKKAQDFHSISEIDSAYLYLQKAEDYYLRINNINKYLDVLLLQTQIHIESGQFDDAESPLIKAEKVNNSQNNSAYLISLNILALKGTIFLYKNQFHESSIFLKEFIVLAEEKGFKNDTLFASVYNDLASNYYFLGDYKNTIILFQKSLKLNIKINNSDGIVTNLNNLGALFQSIGEYQKSIKYINEAISIDLNKGILTDIPIYLNNIGSNYLKLGQYEKALEFFTRALNIDLKSNNKNQIAIDLNNIGWTHKEYGNYNLAIENITKAAKIFNKTGNKLSYGKCLDNLGDLYRETNEYEKSLDALLKANKIFRESGQLKDEAVNLNNTGKLYLNTGKIHSAEECHSKAIIINKGMNALPGVASNYNNLGKIFYSKKEYKQALEYYQKTINILIPEYKDKDVLSLPKTDNIPVEKELLTAVKAKAEIFLDIYSETKDNPNALKSAFENYYLAIKIIDKMRISYYSRDKYYLSKNEKSTYEKALHIAKQLYDLTSEMYYINMAWEITEKSKVAYLYELIRENEARLYSNIPDTILLKEKIIKSQIFELERKLRNKLSENPINDLLIDSIKKVLFNKKFHDLENIKNGLESNYPEYYQLKYNNSVQDLSSVKNFTGKNNSLIEYYLGEESLFTFLINKDTIIFNEKRIDNKLFSSVKDLQKYLSNMFQSEQRFNKFAETSSFIYTSLIDDISSSIKDDNLIIVPDGMLGYIPFEILFTKEIDPNETYYKESPYLIKDHAISYTYSATLLINSSKNKLTAPSKELLAIAPSFSISDDLPAFLTERGEEFIDLIGSRIEVNSINKIFKGELYVDSIATEANFKKFASNYKILHIATHGLIDDKDPMNSRLLFYRNNDSIQDGDLYTYELFNMQLNAELAVLSACNTGYGKLEEGEGIISLARGFLYAGVPSIVMTLWSVPDGTSAIIIENFYSYLKDGYPKNVALQKAKLDYLKNADNLKANPYFWAGFVNIGNTDSFSVNELGDWYFWFVGILVIFLIGLTLRKLRKSV